MPVLSPVKKKSVGLGGSRMGTEENKIAKENTVFMGVLRKKIKTYCYSEIFFLEILINIKAGRVNLGARKVYHGAMAPAGSALNRPVIKGIYFKLRLENVNDNEH
jgi:hypothetical protein